MAVSTPPSLYDAGGVFRTQSFTCPIRTPATDGMLLGIFFSQLLINKFRHKKPHSAIRGASHEWQLLF